MANFLIGQPSWKVNHLLDLDGEVSVSAWYSSTQLFCIFVFSAIYACKKIDESRRSFLIVGLPVVFLMMSIDESVQLHEWLGKMSDVLLQDESRKGTIFEATGIWMFVIGLPFLITFFVWAYAVKEYFLEDIPSFIKLNIGMVVLLLGALGVEIVTNFTYHDMNIYVFEVFIEEGLEMLGATIILWAVYDLSVGYIPELCKKNA